MKTPQTMAEAKALARALRAERGEAGQPISHSAALEAVAEQSGARDWNTLSARLIAAKPASMREAPVQLFERVTGDYLGQKFSGEIVSLSAAGELFRIAIKLEKPIDTVRFNSFSNLRRRLHATIRKDGRSPAKTSDGVPQLCLCLDTGRSTARPV